jgi:acetyl-CoA carboxylase biotin carboxyl carrier protein
MELADILTLLDRLAEIGEKKDIELKYQDLSIKIRRPCSKVETVPTMIQGFPQQMVEPAPSLAPTTPHEPKDEESEFPPGVEVVKSPIVGTFYRAPSPESPPYVEIGTYVKKGDTLCIIEAMKIMNEIEADTEGKVVKILVENGQPVEFGQPLFLIDPNG